MSDPYAHLPYRPCAGIMLRNSDGLVFVGQRLDSSSEAWQMPQGGVDPGEDPLEAAIRELGEEAGIAPHHVDLVARSAGEHLYDLPDDMIGKIWGGKYRGQSQHWFLPRLLRPRWALGPLHRDPALGRPSLEVGAGVEAGEHIGAGLPHGHRQRSEAGEHQLAAGLVHDAALLAESLGRLRLRKPNAV